MHYILLCTALILAGAATVATAQPAKTKTTTQTPLHTIEGSATHRLDHGKRLLAAKDYNGAIDAFGGLIANDKKDTAAYLHRGKAYKVKADKHLNTDQDYRNAIDDFSSVIQLDTAHAEAFYLRGIAKRSMIEKYCGEEHQHMVKGKSFTQQEQIDLLKSAKEDLQKANRFDKQKKLGFSLGTQLSKIDAMLNPLEKD